MNQTLCVRSSLLDINHFSFTIPQQLPYFLRRGFRNDGSVGPVIVPSSLKCYARLAEWALDHHTVDIYVLDENENVLFTFEGMSIYAM